MYGEILFLATASLPFPLFIMLVEGESENVCMLRKIYKT